MPRGLTSNSNDDGGTGGGGAGIPARAPARAKSKKTGPKRKKTKETMTGATAPRNPGRTARGNGGGVAPSPPHPFSGGNHLKAESTIQNRLGLHARAATKLSQALEGYDAEIWLAKGDSVADAKSILDLLGLSCTRNTPIAIFSAGKDARAALDTAVNIIENNFGEEV